MAYPPTLPPNNRANNTPQANNHPSDHNVITNAFSDVLSELGANPSGASADVTTRLTPFTWTPPDVIIRAASGGAVKLGVVTTDYLVVNATTATVNVPITTTGGITAAQQITCAARVQAWDLNLTGGPAYFPSGHTVGDFAGELRMTSASNSCVMRVSSGAFAQMTHVGLFAASTNAGTDWNNRPIYAQGPNLAGIGMNSQGISQTGAMQLFTSATTGGGFHFVNGNNSAYVSTHAQAFTVVSSRKAKANIKPWKGDGLDVVRRLNPVTFTAKVEPDTDGNTPVVQPMLGYIAEELASVLPEVVENDPGTGKPRGIMYDSIIPVLAVAIRRLDERLDKVEKRR